MNGNLKTILIFVEQTLDLDEVVLLEGVQGVCDVVPHFGFQLSGTIAEGQREIGLSGLLGLDLFGNDYEAGGEDLIFVLSTIR